MSAGAFFRAGVRRGMAMPPLWVARPRPAHDEFIFGREVNLEICSLDIPNSDPSGDVTPLDWSDAPTPYTPPVGGGSNLIASHGLGLCEAGDTGSVGAVPGVVDIAPEGKTTADYGGGREGSAARKRQRGLKGVRVSSDADQRHTEILAKASDEASLVCELAEGIVEDVSRPAARRCAAATSETMDATAGETAPSSPWGKLVEAHRNRAPSARGARAPMAFEIDPDEPPAPPARRPRPAPLRPSVARAAVSFTGKRWCDQCERNVTCADGQRCRSQFCRIGGAR